MRDFREYTNAPEGNDPTATDYLGAININNFLGEMVNTVTRAGLTPTPDTGTPDADTTQMAQALFVNSTKATFFAAGGSANAIELTPLSGASGVVLPPSYGPLWGTRIIFYPSAANTGPVTVNIGQTAGSLLGAKPLTSYTGAALTGGELVAGEPIEVFFDSVAFRILPWARNAENATVFQTVSASPGAGALTCGYGGGNLQFRSTTISSGTPISMKVDPLSLVIPSGATLGVMSGRLARLVLVVLYNGGAPQLGIVNLAGGVDLDETDLISSTAINASSTAANVVYTTSSITSSPYRVVGIIATTEPAAGTWATTPALVQGHGGQAIAALQSLGFGQTWQNVLASRVAGTTYYNTTERPITVNVAALSSAAASNLACFVDAVQVGFFGPNLSGSTSTITFIVPPGSSYRATVSSASISIWAELR